MASTTSQIDTGLDAISESLATRTVEVRKWLAAGVALSKSIAEIGSDNAGLVADIQALSPNDAYNDSQQARLTKLIAEYLALKAIPDTTKDLSV